MGGFSPQLFSSNSMSHESSLRSASVFLLLLRLLSRNRLALRIQLHPEGQTHFGKYFFDLVERFPSEIFGLQHFSLGLLDQFADRLDVGVLEAVVGPHGKFQFPSVPLRDRLPLPLPPAVPRN